jgi:hypothetical protein
MVCTLLKQICFGVLRAYRSSGIHRRVDMTCEEIDSRVSSLRSELVTLLEWDRLFWDPHTADEFDWDAHSTRMRRRMEVFLQLKETHRWCLAAASAGGTCDITACVARRFFADNGCTGRRSVLSSHHEELEIKSA